MAKRKTPPRARVDLEDVEKLGELQVTDKELAAFYGVSDRTIRKWKTQIDGFADALERGKERGKTSLRRAQWQKALGGNATMQIWLGKQHLGQVDRKEVDLTELPLLVIDGLEERQAAEEKGEKA